MGRMDAAANLKAIQNAPEPVDRLNLLSRWIASKLDALSSVEERLDKRLEHLQLTEHGLKNLFDLLRKQVADTQPVLKELTQLRQSAIAAVEQLAKVTKGRPAVAPPPAAAPAPVAIAPAPVAAAPAPAPVAPPAVVQIDPRIEERIANQLAAYEQKISQLCQSAEQMLVQRSGKIDDDMAVNFKSLDNYIQHRLMKAQQDTDALVNRVSDKLNVANTRANEIANAAEVNATESLGRIRAEFESMATPIQQRLLVQVKDMEFRISSDMATIEETMKAQLNGFYLHLDRTGLTFQNQLESLAADFRNQAETTLASTKQAVRQQIDSMEDEVRLAIRPIVQIVDDHRITTEHQCEAMLAGMDEAMKIRLGELRRGGESMIQIVETQLVDKLKLIRPQAQAAVESVEKHVGQRLQMAMDNARASVELGEQQLADRIEELRPRAAAAVQAAKTEINQQIASLESEASTATGWIEQRLTQRIDDLTYRARRTVGDQIRELDDATERLRRREGSDRLVEQPGQSLEVDIHVENPQQRPTAA
ncbi:MAG TPA: hypothetical protein VHS31_10715 [Tepidisphaeraceae bacterium]|nr:hypothetical protein [Tepidisphaeraceae bacterium]